MFYNIIHCLNIILLYLFKFLFAKLILYDRTFCLMSFEYGISAALNAVGFMETLKFALKLMGSS